MKKSLVTGEYWSHWEYLIQKCGQSKSFPNRPRKVYIKKVNFPKLKNTKKDTKEHIYVPPCLRQGNVPQTCRCQHVVRELEGVRVLLQREANERKMLILRHVDHLIVCLYSLQWKPCM